MNRSVLSAAFVVATTLGACAPLEDIPLDGARDPLADPSLTEAGSVLAKQVRRVGDVTIRMQKVEVDGEIVARYFTADGAPFGPDALPTPPRTLIDPAVAAALEAAADDAAIEVRVGLVAPPAFDADDPNREGTHAFGDDGRYTATLDDETLTLLGEATLREERFARIAARRALRHAWRAEAWETLAGLYPIDQPALSTAVAEGARSAVLALTPAQIEAFAETADDLVALIELPDPRSNALAAAMVDTSVDPVVFRNPLRQGEGVGVYFSEWRCPAPGDLDDYRRLNDVAASDHDRRVARIIRGVAPRSFIYCRSGFRLPARGDLDGVGGDPAILVENHSWGSKPLVTDGLVHGDTRYIATDRDFDDHVYEDGVAVFAAAGNGGTAPTHGVETPSKALNVTAVGNYYDRTDEIRESSSWRDPETGNRKPELSAPGAWIGVDGLPGTASGTSFSSPHAAAFAADLMGAYRWLQLRPSYLGAFMIAGATDPIDGGFDRVGFGGIDMQSAFYSGTNTWWDGRNDSFAWYDDRDVEPGNGSIDRAFYVDADRHDAVRVALRWATRGSYTYDHRRDAHPIGRDLDITVYDPDGRRVGGSFSWDDPFEVVDFVPARSGTYTVRIHEFANRDAALRLRMGLSINFY